MTNSSKASDEGVQNDFLPLFDGSDVAIDNEGKTSDVIIDTSNILFVVSGAFQKNKTSELIVEVIINIYLILDARKASYEIRNETFNKK